MNSVSLQPFKCPMKSLHLHLFFFSGWQPIGCPAVVGGSDVWTSRFHDSGLWPAQRHSVTLKLFERVLNWADLIRVQVQQIHFIVCLCGEIIRAILHALLPNKRQCSKNDIKNDKFRFAVHSKLCINSISLFLSVIYKLLASTSEGIRVQTLKVMGYFLKHLPPK